jgi:alanine dehydrogenase
MKDCMEILEHAFLEEAQGQAANRTKSSIHIPTEGSEWWYRYCSMEGGLRTPPVAAVRIKSDMVSWPLYSGIRRESKYCVRSGRFCGLVLLFSAENGEPLAILNDGEMQHMRVAATAGIAARFLANKTATSVGILGSGGMAESHLEAYNAVRKLEKIKVFSPNKDNRENYARRMTAKLGVRVEPVPSASEVFAGSEIVASCTDANEPIIPGSWLEPGVHLTCVRSAEAAKDVYPRLDRYVAYRSGMAISHFTSPENERPFSLGGTNPDYFDRVAQVPENRRHHLNDILLNRVYGREGEKEINMFMSEGTGVQFAAVAYRAYMLAKQVGAGKEIPTDWFLQDIRD